jgi:hypothetical protein
VPASGVGTGHEPGHPAGEAVDHRAPGGGCDDRGVGIEHHVERTGAVRARTSVVGALMLVSSVFVACGNDDEPTAAPETCASLVDRASRAIEVREQVDLLDDAIVSCRAIEALDVELRRHPGIIGFDTATFIANRCDRSDDETVTSSPICGQSLSAAPTTTVAVVEEVYEGQTLDGRMVEIRPSDVAFVEGKPEPIVRIVDIATEDGCEALAAERATWQALLSDPERADQASVYARHADNVAIFVGCTAPPTSGE